MGSAFDHNPSITVPSSSTNTGIVTGSGTGANTFLDSTVLVVGNNITIPGTITFGGTQITSTAAELNKLDGASSNVTAANLTALTGGGATALHSHSGGGPSINGATENELVTVANNTANLDAEANLTFDGQNLTFSNPVTSSSSTNLMVYSSYGNSTSTPARLILRVASGNTGDAFISFHDQGGAEWAFGLDNTDDKIKLGYGGTVDNNTRLTIQTNGKVGIGTTSPAMTLHVEESGGDYSAKFKTTHGSAINGIHLEGTATGSPSGRWFTAKWGGSNDEDKAAIAFDGTFYSRTSSYGGFSDERLKENIVDAPSSLAELMKLKIKDFNLIGDGVGGTQRGIIAQEFLADGVSIPNFIKTLEPDVTTPDAIEYYTAAYSKLIPWLVQAVQELKTEIDALKA